MLGNLRTKMEKVSNRKFLLTKLNVLYQWVREDPATKKQKLQLFRTMGGRLQTDLEQHTAYRMVEFLVEVSKGRPPVAPKKRGYYPYGDKASKNTSDFRNCPFTYFAFTLTTVYAYIRYDPHHTIHIILSTSYYPHHTIHIILSTGLTKAITQVC